MKISDFKFDQGKVKNIYRKIVEVINNHMKKA